MAETFVAVRHGPAGFEQRVCLKRILPSRATDVRFVELFLDEARLLARMHRANIVQVYDFGEADGTHYMALELVEGADLDALLATDHVRRAPLPVDAALHVAAELLSALDYAHALQLDGQPLHIVHRDVSPSNILVSAHGEVKLTDFGIAKARGRTHRTQTGHTKGKPAYMSPEQVRGDPLDHRTDLFSAGVVLYQTLSGEHPFDASTDLTLLNNILAGTRRPLREFDGDLPADLLALVDALLEVDPDRRPATAADALAYISASVRSIAGQRLLAERVGRYIAQRAASRVATREMTTRPPYVSPSGVTQPFTMQTSTVSSRLTPRLSSRPPHSAKNTTGRPLHATSSARRMRGFAAGAAAALLAVGGLGSWAMLRQADAGGGADGGLPALPELPSARLAGARALPEAGSHATPREDSASALAPVPAQRAALEAAQDAAIPEVAMPEGRSAPREPALETRGSAPRGFEPRVRERRLDKPRGAARERGADKRRRALSAEPRDAGVRQMIEVSPDQF